MFIAIKGNIIDGHEFIANAIKLGAKSIICESIPSDIQNGITYLEVNCSREALSVISSNYYDNPSKKIKLIGVTGTNGKTTIATLLFNLYNLMGFQTGDWVDVYGLYTLNSSQTTLTLTSTGVDYYNNGVKGLNIVLWKLVLMEYIKRELMD